MGKPSAAVACFEAEDSPCVEEAGLEGDFAGGAVEDFEGESGGRAPGLSLVRKVISSVTVVWYQSLPR